MKKKYIRPESRLLLINLAENIATSIGGAGDTNTGDLINGAAVIHFTAASNGCRGYYTADTNSPVTVGQDTFFYAYLMEMFKYAGCKETGHYHFVNENECLGSI